MAHNSNSPQRYTVSPTGASQGAKPPWLPDIPKSLKIIHLSLGFFGWYLAGALLWRFPDLVCVFFPANLLLAFFLIRTRRGWIAQGLFIAWLTNLLFSLVAGTFLDALMLAPFFVKF